MIGKIFPKSAGSFKGRIRYIFGCTKHDHEITGIRTIDSNCTSSDPLPGILAGDETDVLEMIREFDSVEAMRRMSIDSEKAIKPVFHTMLSLRPGESLTTSQWRTAVQTYLTDLGFDETTQYVAVMHQDKDHQHVHIVANRIRLDDTFSMVKDSNERSTSLDSVSRIEDRFGLTKAPKPKNTWGVSITHAELQASIRDGDLPLKHKMIAKIAGAIEATNAQDGDMFTFTRLLRKQRVYINLTLNDEGQPKGISFEFDGKHISGRQLKRSRLTWHKLTTQEGIKYDPETIRELQIEVARRDSEEQERTRIYYYEFIAVNGRRKKPIYVRFTAKDYEVQKLIQEILELLDEIFDALFKPKECRVKRTYIEYVPGQPLDLDHHDELTFA
ncbi:relaxase/mobilization nuclease domain-containing protein [Pseudomonas fulva]|uniref:Relaxase/mobilization nuclease domain-containing protein n=1 Tax=Pseudomonas fulva TaxID=47880 RepID=A0A7S9LKA5_9PSED|nr:relaxase/mobilization nuclease domain-containing protein [Pseudomonas fulva]QPH45589.1 relaxase/mobilization nuclease domain-containing protein [Pseudomonas fulva]QPH50674.1 relaxase/mobilization nuclease domain-containing protein [Pseudomonas fulva]